MNVKHRVCGCFDEQKLVKKKQKKTNKEKKKTDRRADERRD